jgi:copper(I)-binding protein
MKPFDIIALAAAVALLAIPPLAGAHAYDAGPLHIGHPWARPTPDGAPTAAGYLTVVNRGATPERLLGGQTPVADSIEPHTMSMGGGVMRMRLAPDGFEIAPGATLTLAPGGDHLMFIGLQRPFRAGDRIPATLRFAHAGAVRVEFVVQGEAPAEKPAKPMSMPGMDMR